MIKLSRRQLIQLTIILLIVTLALIVFLNIFHRHQTSQTNGQLILKIETLPKDAIIKVDQSETKNSPAKLNLTPGKYTISVERFGFKTVNYQIELEKDSTEYIALEPITDEAKAWKEHNNDLYQKFAGISEVKAEQEATDFGKKYPLVTKLPQKNNYFNIGTNGSTILIHAPLESHHLAVDFLKSFKLDLSIYNYKFIDDDNPNQETNPFKIEVPVI